MKNIIDYNPNFSVRVINGVAKLFISDNGKEKQFKPVNPEPPVPPVPPVPTDRILYTVVEGGYKPFSKWITTNCSDNVFDDETGEGYLVLKDDVTTLVGWIDQDTKTTYTIFLDIINGGDGDKNISEVIIPSGITEIGDYAFGACSGLTSIDIPNSVTSIGEGAFAGSGIISIVIPDSVTSIGYGAFSGCSALTSATLSNSITSIEATLFYACESLTSIIIPNSVTSIGASAFLTCTSLASVICFATTPPALDGVVFSDIATTTCSVPSASISAYRGSSWYNNPFTTFTAIQ